LKVIITTFSSVIARKTTKTTDDVNKILLIMKTKYRIGFRSLITLVVISILFAACKKKEDLVIAPITFNPLITYGSMTDQDGNTYKTVTIGTQVWMAENLKTTKYRNGDAVQNVADSTQWRTLTSGAYCYYNNISQYIEAYGFLYNWYTIIDIRNLAPTGWHIATETDWSALNDFLGGGEQAAHKLQEQGTSHWNFNDNGTNESGFTALPGGMRHQWKTFAGMPFLMPFEYMDMGLDGYWWTPTSIWNIWSGGSLKLGRFPDHSGLSVRCVKD
jgi:uncharacterized protein (TIGR02145 family)